MFKDMELAREEVSSYKMMLEDRTKALSAVHAMDLLDKPLLDLNVSVLSASAWPSYPDVAVEIPRDVQKACVGFEQYYRLKHTGRKLAWKHSLAHCQLKASFSRGNKELIVSSYQTVVLLVFNERSGADQVPYTEIQGATNLSKSASQFFQDTVRANIFCFQTIWSSSGHCSLSHVRNIGYSAKRQKGKT